MVQVLNPAEVNEPDWHLLISLHDLDSQSVKMVRVAGKQIAVFNTPDGIRACDNRCPHEGYPLSEGSLSSDCILTCNWHNWKFNLDTGENLFGGDRLRTYPLEVRDDEIWIDITELPHQKRYTSIISSLQDAFDDYSYDRIAREIARLVRLGADPFDVLRLAIDWSWQKMEFGWTHAYAGMADWITLYEENRQNEELKLVCLVESVTHVAYDVLRERDILLPKRPLRLIHHVLSMISRRKMKQPQWRRYAVVSVTDYLLAILNQRSRERRYCITTILGMR